jgi:transcriptional regulator with XRE-family HTH domain
VTRTLRDLRVARDLTLREVEEASRPVGVNGERGIARVWAAHLSEIERGKRVPSPDQLAILSDLYGVSRDGWVLLYVQASEEGA